MSRMKMLTLPILLLGALACSDANAPLVDGTDDSTFKTSPHFQRWDALGSAPRFSAAASSEQGEISLYEHGLVALYEGGAADYTVSFWAVRGEQRALDIYYDDIDTTSYDVNDGKFLRLEITDPVALADGSTVAVGDSVLITVTVDAGLLLAEFQPSGIQFSSSSPTELWMWYKGTDDDYDDDADIDSDDSYIQNNLLSVYVQEDPNNPWSSLSTQHQLTDRLFYGVLEHFSGYAISW